jgi:hypothetical protein
VPFFFGDPKMALEQDFLPFATGVGANVVSQAVYAALSALSTGYQSGVAQSAQLNKTWRQSSIAASVLAQFIVNNSGQPAIDDGTTSTLLTNLTTAVTVCARQNPVLADTGSANAYAVANAAAFTTYPTASGLTINVAIAHTNTGASTLNVDGLGAKPIYGLGLQALQGGELSVNGVASLMYVVASNVNSGNGGWIILECTGGSQQVTTASQSQHAVQFGQLTGLVGSMRNAAMNITVAASSATFTADQIVVASALNGLQYLLSNYNKTINLATTGAGGMDTGSPPASGFVGIYAIYNPTTGATSILATNATSAAAPNVYGGANMPSGYTASALISVWRVNSGSQLIAGVQIDRMISMPSVTVLNVTTTQASFTALSITTAIPINAKSFFGSALLASTSSSTLSYALAASSTGIGSSSNQGNVTQGIGGAYGVIPIVTAQTLYYQNAVSAGSTTFTLTVSGYTI